STSSTISGPLTATVNECLPLSNSPAIDLVGTVAKVDASMRQRLAAHSRDPPECGATLAERRARARRRAGRDDWATMHRPPTWVCRLGVVLGPTKSSPPSAPGAWVRCTAPGTHA